MLWKYLDNCGWKSFLSCLDFMETDDQRFHPAKDKYSKRVLLRNAYSSKHKSSRAKL